MIVFIVFLAIFFHMSLVWIWYRITNNPSVIDVGWAIGLTLSGLIYLGNQSLSLRTATLGLALLIWGIRLGGYLWWTRIRKNQVDKRYIALSHSWKIKQPLGFFIHFQLQGFFIFIVSLSWYFTALNPSKSLHLLDVIALTLFLFALTLESIADHQLSRFKKEHKGKVCNTKLWRLSRHPNCFFEWLIWCAFAIFALPSPYGAFGILSPLALYCIMVYLTIPITERESIKSRGQSYIDYQSVTPLFFPW